MFSFMAMVTAWPLDHGFDRGRARSGRGFRDGPFIGARWHAREQEAQSLGNGQVRDDGVAQSRIRKAREHGRLYGGHYLACFGADHRESEDAVIRADDHLHEALLLAGRVCTQHGAHRQSRDACADRLPACLRFAQAHMGERRVGEHAIGDEAVARRAVRAREIGPDDLTVVGRGVGELRAAGAFPERPYPRCGRLEPLVDAYIAALVRLDAGNIEPDPPGVPARGR